MHNKSKAFTLVELIVVIAILAILGTIVFISLQGYSEISRNSVRISDTGNIETSLELFFINTNKYPEPDNSTIIDYEGETIWKQGVLGQRVIGNISNTLQEVPKDPLLDTEYIYTVLNNKNEYEILNVFEGDLSFNGVLKINAANIDVTPRINGTYNGVLAKTASYIIGIPSIVTSENIGAGMTLNGTNIKSQVITGGTNIPNIGKINSTTGQLTGLELAVYTGSIFRKNTDVEKGIVLEKIQEAYSGSILNYEIYKDVLDTKRHVKQARLLDIILLNKTSGTYKLDVSCKDILNKNIGAPDRVYYIDPQNNGKGFKIYCDMTTDGGGWTLVSKYSGGSSGESYHTATGFYLDNLLDLDTSVSGVQGFLGDDIIDLLVNGSKNTTFRVKSANYDTVLERTDGEIVYTTNVDSGATFRCKQVDVDDWHNYTVNAFSLSDGVKITTWGSPSNGNGYVGYNNSPPGNPCGNGISMKNINASYVHTQYIDGGYTSNPQESGVFYMR